MTAITFQLDDDMAQEIRRLAAAQKRSETDILRDALAAYVQPSRPSAAREQSQAALEIRAEWMRLMGLADDEIAAACKPENGPADLEEEARQLDAAKRLQTNRPAYEQLKQLADQCTPPDVRL